MATGYSLPNGVKDYSGSGFSFTQTSYYTYNSNGYLNRAVGLIGHGVCRQCYSQPSTSTPTSIFPEYNCTSGTIYNWPRNAFPSVIGSISSFEFYRIGVSAITNGSTSSGGTVAGGGNYDAGTAYTVSATPADGFLLTALTGYAGDLPTTKTASVSLSATADQNYRAVFQKYYNITFDANGGTNAPGRLTYCYYDEESTDNYYRLPQGKPTWAGHSFLGWSVSQSATVATYQPGDEVRNLTADEDITLYAVWAQYSVTYDANGGTPTPSSVTGASGDTINLAGIGETTREGYVLTGWTIGRKTYAPGDSYTLTAEDVTAVAVWRRPTIYITNSDAGRGTLKLYRSSVVSANLVATESDGVLAADAADGVYIVVCEQKDPLYRGKGLGASEADIDYPATTDASGENTTRFELQGTLVELSFYYARRKTYRVDFAYSPAEAGTAFIQKRTDGIWPSDASVASEPDETVDGEPRWLPQVLRFLITSAAGYDCRSLHVVDSTDGTSSQPSVTNPPAVYVCDLMGMDDDVRVDLVFERQKFDVSVGVDAASASVGVATVESTAANDSASGIPSVEYGSGVTFRASLKEGVSATDYRFEGWYADGVRIGTEAVLSHTVTGVVSVVAKFAARIRLGLVFSDNRSDTTDPIIESAALAVNGKTAFGGAYDGFTVLGGSLTWSVTPGSMGAAFSVWSFNAWYAADDTAFAAPLEYGRSGSLDVSESVNMVARLTAVKISSTLIVKVHVNDPATDVSPDIADPVISSAVAATVQDGGYAFTIDGSGSLTVTAKASIAVKGKSYAFNGFATGIPCSAGYRMLSGNVSYTRFLNEPTRTVWALYGEPQNVTVTLAYGGGGNRTMGVLSIDGETNEESGGATVAKTVRQGETVSIAATARNGYRFVGWYFGGSTSGEPDGLKSPTTVYVTGEMTVLALFVRDARAVYEWEGSAVNKMMEWKSKVYVSPRPFNPSALRVDTEGYPVGEVRIGMFSSPDGGETAVAAVKNLASQDVRRLPKRRPERYLQVTVKNDHEVDRILVGTSMEGLAV